MKIIAMPLYGIGDVLMTTPALRNIKEQLGARLTYLHMFKSTKEILDRNPFIDENIHFPFLEAGRLGGLRFLLSLRGRFDASVNFYPSNRHDYNLASFITGSPIRAGHTYNLCNFKEFNFLKNRVIREDDSIHNVEENLRLLALLGIKEQRPCPMEIYLSDEEKDVSSIFLKENGFDETAPLIGLHPGTSAFKNQYRRRWPQERFGELVKELGAIYKHAAFLVFGGPEEGEIKEAVTRASGMAGRILAVNTRSVRETASLISRTSLFISNDSGLMHVAAAFQVPTVAIFGPTNPVWVRPWMCPHRVVRLGLDCSPCFRYSPRPLCCPARKDFACLSDIPVRSVLDAAVSLIK